jgi:hypothetical protein
MPIMRVSLHRLLRALLVVLFAAGTTSAVIASAIATPSMAAAPCHESTGSSDLDVASGGLDAGPDLPVSHACCLNACIPFGLVAVSVFAPSGDSGHPAIARPRPPASQSRVVDPPPPRT